MPLQIRVDPGSQNKERSHKYTAPHDLYSILELGPQLFAMDIISARQLTPFRFFTHDVP